MAEVQAATVLQKMSQDETGNVFFVFLVFLTVCVLRKWRAVGACKRVRGFFFVFFCFFQ